MSGTSNLISSTITGVAPGEPYDHSKQCVQLPHPDDINKNNFHLKTYAGSKKCGAYDSLMMDKNVGGDCSVYKKNESK